MWVVFTVSGDLGIRPVFSLADTTKYVKGNGTKENPIIINEKYLKSNDDKSLLLFFFLWYNLDILKACVIYVW